MYAAVLTLERWRMQLGGHLARCFASNVGSREATARGEERADSDSRRVFSHPHAFDIQRSTHHLETRTIGVSEVGRWTRKGARLEKSDAKSRGGELLFHQASHRCLPF